MTKRLLCFLLFLLPLYALAQVKISGVVRSQADRTPLEGVTVVVKETQTMVLSGKDGHFSIAAKPGQTLHFSYVGFTAQDVSVPATPDGPLQVQLPETKEKLNEVVVVGYGTQKKVNLTGAVGVVTAAKLQDRPVTNVTNALQGTVSGVTVVSSNGQPGKDNGTIRVRGIGTLNNSDPMVVVDGIISSMNDVNPNDIESISVLKDAASAAIYGSRAANGVILITTKKGKKGTAQVQYNMYVGQQKATRLPDFLPSWQAASLYNETLQNEGKPIRYTDEEIQKFKDGSDPYNYPNTDWLGLFYKGSGFQQNHYASVNGGTDKTQYMFSLGYYDQDGIVKKSDAQRYTMRFNLDTRVTDKFRVSANLAYTYNPVNEPSNPYTGDFSQLFRQINRISPIIPYKYANGHYGYIGDGSPMAWLESPSFNHLAANYLVGNTTADLEIVKGLHLRPTLGYRLITDQNKKFLSDIQYYNAQGTPTLYQGPNSLTDHDDQTRVVTLQGVIDYGKTWGDHNFKILGGYSQEYTKYSELEGYRKGFLNNSLSELNAGPTDGQKATGYGYEVALQSFFGRVNYDYKGKYLLEGNLRYDASSRFASDNRWGLFPSVSAGWRVSEESFFEPLKNTVSNLKVRASWGQLGNQNLDAIVDADGNKLGVYPYITSVSAGQNYSFNNTIAAGVAPTKGANAAITWETTTETDFGIDAGFLHDALNVSADYFIKNTDNILLNVPVSSTYGLTAPIQNAGSVQNKGFEISADYHNHVGDFTYSVGANTAFIRNKVTDLHGTGPIISGVTYKQVGEPINSFYGYQATGIFQTQDEVDKHATQSGGKIAPGDIAYKDQNNDGVIDGNDRVYLGSYFPKMTYGINLGLGWKGIDVSAFFQGAAGVKGYVEGEVLGQTSNGAGKPTSALLDRWTPENHSTAFPRLWSTYTQNDALQTPSSFWVRNANYLRLKNLQIGYNLPAAWLHAVRLQKVRFYYSGQNIWTHTAFYSWIDPEAPAGERGYTYPQVKVNTLGLNVTF
ncbi:hypothetical protein DCC81_18290 [Chitinophaga parva]|uniref:SusC/RagA family TonB-linked outer membrane protein n=1 Tax=Chitinophaga parva TaxID=2169414 RepID=A0A2T7BIS8_9BACT|nr:TonB-dependent receptor [Chitinophaga parva]PUZ26185.1 hypothetical protein DCC81_18290 [Chitinophaga parva]